MRSISPLTADHQHLLLHPQHPQGRLMIFLFVFFFGRFFVVVVVVEWRDRFRDASFLFSCRSKAKKNEKRQRWFFFSSSPSTEENESGEGDNKTPKTATVGRHRSRPSAPSRFIKRRRWLVAGPTNEVSTSYPSHRAIISPNHSNETDSKTR